MTPSRLNATVHLGFVVTGMVTTLLGPVLPLLAAQWSLNDTRAGYFFTAEFLGSIAGVALSGFIVPRLGFTRSLACGYVLLALGVGVLSVTSATWHIALAAVAGYGFGLGITIPATNLWIAERTVARRAAALNLVNLAWGIGAVALPAMVALAVRAHYLQWLLASIAATSFVIAVLFSSAPGREPIPAAPQADHKLFPRWRWQVVLAILFYLYVGAENGVAGWIAMFADRLHVTAGPLWAATPSLFWGALLVGRALAPAVLRHVSEARLLAAGLSLSALGVGALIAAHGFFGVVAGTMAAGLGMSSVFPLLIAKITQRFGEHGARAAGPIFAFGGLGGATLPWAVGFVSQHGAGLRGGLAVPLTAVLLMGVALMLAGD
jgi:FHS family glucose/mannose:H+ symporter-like MFS transporter